MNTILIVCDQLTGLKYLDKELLNDLEGINKFKKRCIFFDNHYCNSVPCSASRATMYTGKNSNDNKVTDNVQNGINWQKSMPTVSEGLKTLGTYFKQNKESRYVGKIHLLQELDPKNYTKYAPRLATENYLMNYDFDIFNKMGDFCYDPRFAFFNDKLVTKELLPNGTNKDKCDFYDINTNECFDGAIPYMKKKILKNENFLLCCNYDNPHDILYTNIQTNQTNLVSPSMQINGLSKFKQKDLQSVVLYNENFQKYDNIEPTNAKSIIVDNAINSSTNNDSIDVFVLIMILQKYYFYGIDYRNLEQYKQYQTAYYRCIKQVDDELSKLYDFFEENGLFENSVICLTSDHGEYNGAHGLLQKAAPIYNEGSNVPLFISYPNMQENYKNFTCSIISSHLNLLPTLLVLSGFNEKLLEIEKLHKPMINSNGLINYTDFNVVFIFLSVTFGALLSTLSKMASQNNIMAQIKLLSEKLYRENYLTLKGFSVCSKFLLNNEMYNCGYYYSLFDIYSSTIKYYKNNISFLESLYIEWLNNDSNNNTTHILKDNSNNSIVAFVGSKNYLEFQKYSDPYIKSYFNDPVIVEYEPTTSPYNKYLTNDPIYNKSLIFTFLEVKNAKEQIESNINNERKILNKIENDTNALFIIINKLSNTDIVFVGTLNNLLTLKSFNLPEINSLVGKDNVIIPVNDYFDDKSYLFLNNPLLTSVKIAFINKNANINKIISQYFNNYKITQNIILNDNKLLLKLLNNEFSDNLYNNNTYNNYIFDSIFNFTYELSNKNLLRLPGLDYSVGELISENHQLQVFNNTIDEEELYNLADSSRINYKNNTYIVEECIDKLYKNIKINNLENIFISLPSSLIFENTNFFTEI